MTDAGRTQPLAARDDVVLDPATGEPVGRAPVTGDRTHGEPVHHDPEYDDRPYDDPAVHDGRHRRDHRDHQERRDPVEMAKEPDNRAKLALGTAVLTALNLLLLIFLLVAVLNDSGDEVIVDGVPCLIADGDEASVLYCRR